MISGLRVLYALGMCLGFAFLAFAIMLAMDATTSRSFDLLMIVIGLVIGVTSAILSIRQKLNREQRGITGKDPMKIFENMSPPGHPSGQRLKPVFPPEKPRDLDNHNTTKQ